MTRSAPRARPIALAGLSLIAGLLVGLREPALGFFPAAGLAALVFAAAAIRWNRRGHLVISSLITLAIGGALLGQVEQRLARQDCRKFWAVGHPVSLAGIALGYMPAGERGAIRIRPTAPPAEGCRWVGPMRVWTDGPAIPGTVYRVDGTWRPARYLRSARRPPERWGWVAVDSMILLRPAQVREHPILTARGATA